MLNTWHIDIEEQSSGIKRTKKLSKLVHSQRFGEALRGVQEKLAEKKFYMNNNKNCGCN